ncbi:MAG TPA: hypothetical protein VFA10_17850 [Ktedonobacteraceae bacterium]|nr:hypothetical protein [Ktedonobacteraceae bacterium]
MENERPEWLYAGDFTWLDIPVSKQDEQFVKTQQYIASRICNIFGISFQELGFDEKTVEGSVSPVIDDPARLLGEAE